jgi:hypothetical protein
MHIPTGTQKDHHMTVVCYLVIAIAYGVLVFAYGGLVWIHAKGSQTPAAHSEQSPVATAEHPD